MKKRTKTLMCCTLILAVSFAIYYFFSFYKSNNEDPKEAKFVKNNSQLSDRKLVKQSYDFVQEDG